MTWIVDNLWWIPALPLLASGIIALCPRRLRRTAAVLAIGALAGALVLACAAFAATLPAGGHDSLFREVRRFDWVELGTARLALGWVLDPLSASMLVLVSFVGLLIFIYSVGYMAQDDNFTRFFCFLALFAGAMLGLVVANHLLLLFICWELVGLASYLLIGFWYHKPAAAAAAKKAFITTRLGDLGLFLGLLWLYAETGTLFAYDRGQGCLEAPVLAALAAPTGGGLMALSTALALLLFWGAVGKSGQVPLHVWLPDAMEGPTPVSALIHAATMVAAGVFLVARVYPLMSAGAGDGEGSNALAVVTWVGAITAVLAALIAVAQTDLKRILAYSTVSQLGYMMMGLGVGGVAVGMFHLITHAFFKALLFLGAGSVIHGCHGEQDIRRLGGLRRFMPVTFATYAIGMLALTGVPLFSGFWSKDAILHAAHGWPFSRLPFWLGLFGAFLTAFYMTRQVALVFGGAYRGGVAATDDTPRSGLNAARPPHESPRVMTMPLVVLAGFAALLGLLGTPMWPWFQSYLGAAPEAVTWLGFLGLMLGSTAVVGAGLWIGWWLYGRRPAARATDVDPLELAWPGTFAILRGRFFVDELYQRTVIRWHDQFAQRCRQLDECVLDMVVQAIAYLVWGISWLSRIVDDYAVNLGFDRGCGQLRQGGGRLARLQNGRVQSYLRSLGVALTVLVLALLWGCRP
jgi:NADH-quinone oxidoreductase subunit L